ncbi:MAG TPA: hypothetical protein VLA12_00410 [Planctomycetaceae bacterium]|nr:hypothetical protein [Planctomycetaceae bacterium]
MFRQLMMLVLMIGFFPQSALAQSAKLEEVRIITNERLSSLSFLVRHYNDNRKLFKTEELKNRLKMVPPTDSLLITKAGSGNKDTVWYTDPATTRPNSISIDRVEHDLLSEYADGGLSRVLAMTAGPRIVTEEKEVIDPDGNKIMVPVTKTVNVMPSEGEIKTALDEIAAVKNPDLRAALELAAGARFAELFPPDSTLPAPNQAISLASSYREQMIQEAIQLYANKPASELPPYNEPLLFGKSDAIDQLSIARAVQGSTPAASFKTKDGKFAAVWDKSTLVLLRQPEDFNFSAPYNTLKLNDLWMNALDPKNKKGPSYAFPNHPQGRIGNPR